MRNEMRRLLDLCGTPASIVREGRSVTLSNGKRIIERPTRSDLVQMLKTASVLRGAIYLEDALTAFVWPGRTMAHDLAAQRIFSDIEYEDGVRVRPMEFVTGFKLGESEEAIQQDPYWRETKIYHRGSFLVAFGPIYKIVSGKQVTIEDIPAMPVFRTIPAPSASTVRRASPPSIRLR